MVGRIFLIFLGILAIAHCFEDHGSRPRKMVRTRLLRQSLEDCKKSCSSSLSSGSAQWYFCVQGCRNKQKSVLQADSSSSSSESMESGDNDRAMMTFWSKFLRVLFSPSAAAEAGGAGGRLGCTAYGRICTNNLRCCSGKCSGSMGTAGLCY